MQELNRAGFSKPDQAGSKNWHQGGKGVHRVIETAILPGKQKAIPRTGDDLQRIESGLVAGYIIVTHNLCITENRHCIGNHNIVDHAIGTEQD